jgi:archaellum component FlaG (FlaF/FlaG flagellin family)
MGTGIMNMQGPWDSSTKTITLSGSILDPATRMDTNMRQTFTVIDDKTQLMQMFANGPDGKEFKTMEIKYTRK